MSLAMLHMLVTGLAIIAFAANTSYAADRTDIVTAETANGLYHHAVEDARAGNTAAALAMLRSLVESFPERQDMLGDYAVVLGWTGDHAGALALLDRINRRNAPSHVIEGLAGSARATKQFELAETLYREAMARFPERLEPQIGLARTLADAGKLDAATALIEDLRAKHPRRIDVLEAAADIATARHDYFGALAAW